MFVVGTSCLRQGRQLNLSLPRTALKSFGKQQAFVQG